MSAQIIAALRKRAAALKAEAHALLLGGHVRGIFRHLGDVEVDLD